MRWVSEEDKTDGSETRSDSTRKAVSRRKASGDKDERGQKTGTDYIHERGGDITEHRWSSSGRGRRSQHTATGRFLKLQNRKLRKRQTSNRKTNKSTNWRKTRRDIHSSPKWKLDFHLFLCNCLLNMKKEIFYTSCLQCFPFEHTHTHTRVNQYLQWQFIPPQSASPCSPSPFQFWSSGLKELVYFSISISFSCWFCLFFPNTAKTGRTCISLMLSPVHWPLKAPHNTSHSHTGGRGCCAMCRPDEFGVQYLAQGCVDGGAKESN